jgi:hypothetical protein
MAGKALAARLGGHASYPARQKFDSPARVNFEKQLSYNPWHCIAEHRPLGNQSRARKRMYGELSKLRHDMNGIPHYEPTGDEVFP